MPAAPARVLAGDWLSAAAALARQGMDDQEQEAGAKEGDDHGPQRDVEDAPKAEAEVNEAGDKAAYEGAKQANDNISNNPQATTTHHFTGEKTSNEANHQPDQDTLETKRYTAYSNCCKCHTTDSSVFIFVGEPPPLLYHIRARLNRGALAPTDDCCFFRWDTCSS